MSKTVAASGSRPSHPTKARLVLTRSCALRIKQRAAQIHRPETPIDVAGEVRAEVGICIGLVARPHLLQQGAKLLLDRKLGSSQVFESTIEINALNAEKIAHCILVSYARQTCFCSALQLVPSEMLTLSCSWNEAAAVGSLHQSGSVPRLRILK